MNTDEITRITHKRITFNEESEDKKIKYLKNLITRILLSVILVISICIFFKLDSNNISLIDKYIFNDSLEFTKINNWYQKNVGNILPQTNENASLVFSNTDLTKNKYVPYKDGVKFEVDKGSPISLISGGIVVFIGEKEGYGNTLILQGNDGLDYWYGGITSVNVNLYDYLEKDTLIGESMDNYLYLILQKDGNFLSYEEYLEQI